MMVLRYNSKKELRTHIGHPLDYIETSMFGNEYVANGEITAAGRPHITGMKREFFAVVTMRNGLIDSVK